MSTVPADPPTALAPLADILADFAEHGVRPTPLNILAAALDRGPPEDIAVALANAADRLETSTMPEMNTGGDQ